MTPRETKLPRDYEVMDTVLDRGDAGELARLLSVSPQLVRARCRPPETKDEYATGKLGPLARLRTLISMILQDDGKPDRAIPSANI